MNKIACLLILLTTLTCTASPEKQAVDETLRAVNKQFSITENLEKYLRNKIPTEYVKVAEVVVPIAETLATGEIKLRWEWK